MRSLVLALFLVVLPVSAAPPSPACVDRVVNAIYVIEGGPRARHPYGILSVPVRDAAHARVVCARTVRNTWVRWEAAGRPGDYLTFLANRYCPPQADPVGNRNWIKNIHAYVK